MSNNATKIRRVRRSRCKIKGLDIAYMTVHRTPKHIYAQIHAAEGASVLAAASSLEKGLRGKSIGPGKITMAEEVGKLIAERAQAKGISRIAFDRSGYMYHGRVKALADAARAGGLEF